MTSLNGALPQALATLVRGEGCYVWDDSGKRYLDFLGGIAVNALGHAHPALVEAVSDQISTLGHISNFFLSEPQIELAERLTALAGLGIPSNVFFSNSGAEANEAAFKLVRLHGRNTGKTRVLALEGAFHGRTMGSLALTSNPTYREPFEPLPTGVEHIDISVSSLRKAWGEDVCAIIVEPILGEVGVSELPEGFLEEARRLSHETNALLVVDEVQTGVGRTGYWFAHHKAVDPSAADKVLKADIVTLAKGLAGGVPIGATIAGPKAADLFYRGAHGSTFGGNPVSCRAALAVLSTIENEGLLENAAARGAQLRAGIAALDWPFIETTTGDGLLIGIHLTQDLAPDIVRAALDSGLIVNAPRPNVVRLAPPLIIGDSEVSEFLQIFEQILKTIRSS